MVETVPEIGVCPRFSGVGEGENGVCPHLSGEESL